MISLNAPAKVNLSLYITGVRSDGYHLLDTVMQSVSLYDTVEIRVREDNVINVTCDNPDLSGQENICHKAARLFFQESKVNGGADIHVIKRIPLAAGLGGGSADAAAVLEGLNSEFGSPVSRQELLKLALNLGADVPFCLKKGTARVKGIGEEIASVNRTLPIYMLLIKEGEKPSTAYMYKELDRKMAGTSLKGDNENTCISLENGDYKGFLASVYNDFSLLWDYTKIEKALKRAGAQGVCLSGSGPTVMGFFETMEEAEKAFNVLKDSYKEIFLAEAVNE